MIIKIPLFRPNFDNDELEEIQKVLNSGWVTQGPKVKEFEDRVAEYLGVNMRSQLQTVHVHYTCHYSV